MTAATPTSAVLSAELAAPLAAGAPLIVPTGRIGTVLRAAWDRAQLAAGRQTWLAPPVLTWSEWLAQRVAVVPAALGTAELVLSPAQELALWRRIVADSLAGFGLRGRNPGPLARMAQRAWELQHAYGARLPVESARDTLEQRAYRQWAARFAELADTLGVTDAARVLTRLPPYRAASGDCARCSGFFAATPAQQAQLPSALESIAAAPHARVHCLQYPDVADEVAAVTAWALDARAAGGGHAAPAIVCADTALVPLVEAALDRAVARLSARNVAAAGLAAYRAASPAPPAPMLAAALGLLGEPREIPRGRAAALVASPYLGTAPTDAVGRARAVERLVGDDVRPLDLAALADTVRSVGGAGFGNCLDTMQALAAERQRRRDLKQWLARIEAALDQAGWPGPQPLLGHEEFALKRWRRACDDVAALDLVLPPQSLPEVLALLEQQLHSAGGERPLAVDAIEILTLEEAAAARPQPRWIVGLHAASWPASADISPFLPFALQRAAGMPGAHRERQYALATKIFAAAYGAAGCTASFSAHAANVAQQAVTGLPLDIQRASTLAPPPADQAVFAFVTDDQVPLAPGTAVRGGAAILTDQSACPFRAFAHHRLGARAGEEPLLGPDGRQRGDLVHRVLAAFWRRHRASRAVRALDAAARARAIDAAIEEALREAPPWPVGRGGEPARLRRLCLAWLPVDLEYGDFEVIACETARALTLADLPLELRIDRIDRRADGVVRLVDYKTGSDVRRRMWEPPRPEQPQLPLYALAEPDAGGIAFAQVHPDKPRWVEFPDRREPEPARAFDLERAAWADALHTLARNFVAGAAAVDPLPNACRHCDLQTLCRIRERRGAADAESEDD
jgi:probable DNA repair protein